VIGDGVLKPKLIFTFWLEKGVLPRAGVEGVLLEKRKGSGLSAVAAGDYVLCSERVYAMGKTVKRTWCTLLDERN
jgi:hypothetical protein